MSPHFLTSSAARRTARWQRQARADDSLQPRINLLGEPDLVDQGRRDTGRGQLASWCTFEYDYYKGALPIPYDTILVELAEGPMFVSNPKGFTHRDLKIGMPLKLAFLDCEDAGGPFRLPVFEAA